MPTKISSAKASHGLKYLIKFTCETKLTSRVKSRTRILWETHDSSSTVLLESIG